MTLLTERTLWAQLQKQASMYTSWPSISSFYPQDAEKNQLIKRIGPLTVDFSHQRANMDVLHSLIALAHECELQKKIALLLTGSKINTSENRAALHTVLRDLDNKPVWVDGINITPEVKKTRERIKLMSELIRTKKWSGFTGKPITDIVNIGIGGSDLGPRLCINAFPDYCSTEFNYHFISDVDPESYEEVIRHVCPETTLFIISSKSFATTETLLNARQAMKLYPESVTMKQHFIAITAYPERAFQLGIKNVLPIWDWAGGRYSLCSAVNLITAIAIGYDHFNQLLLGAHAVDTHVSETPFEDNIPVLMALFGIWSNNFLHIHQNIMLAYSKRLEYFIPYIQQLEMESNGKSIDLNGRAVNYATGPVIWGGLGNQAQHSYFQLLCQGTHKSAVDFITLAVNNQHLINAMCEHKIKVLSEGVQSIDHPNGYIPGKIPANHITLADCSPYALGALIALYEHKVFAQSVIWNINPFDQPGVESAKRTNHIFNACSI